MPNTFATLVNSCLHHVTKFVQALAANVFPQPRSTSTRSQTPTTDSDTSARSATKPSVASRNPRLSEAQALTAADQLIRSWYQSGDSNPDTLKRLLANSILSLTDRSAHLGSIATMNEVMYAASLISEDDALHLKLVEQSHVSDALMVALMEVDSYMLLLATSLNDLIGNTKDEAVLEHLTNVRKSVMLAEESIRETIERYEA